MELNLHAWGDVNAPPVVFLHGLNAHGRRFRRLAEEQLADRFHVLAPDLRGHAGSGWEPPWTLATAPALPAPAGSHRGRSRRTRTTCSRRSMRMGSEPRPGSAIRTAAVCSS